MFEIKSKFNESFFWFLIEICKYKCLFVLKDKVGLKVYLKLKKIFYKCHFISEI